MTGFSTELNFYHFSGIQHSILKIQQEIIKNDSIQIFIPEWVSITRLLSNCIVSFGHTIQEARAVLNV